MTGEGRLWLSSVTMESVCSPAVEGHVVDGSRAMVGRG